MLQSAQRCSNRGHLVLTPQVHPRVPHLCLKAVRSQCSLLPRTPTAVLQWAHLHALWGTGDGLLSQQPHLLCFYRCSQPPGSQAKAWLRSCLLGLHNFHFQPRISKSNTTMEGRTSSPNKDGVTICLEPWKERRRSFFCVSSCSNCPKLSCH